MVKLAFDFDKIIMLWCLEKQFAIIYTENNYSISGNRIKGNRSLQVFPIKKGCPKILRQPLFKKYNN